ncbi:MAG: energy-coupling factor ABC transporter permease [Planctomycetes bacterium]|nr:energy-coupling factor ABC transporter permease [Planctomycetota bacterium]
MHLGNGAITPECAAVTLAVAGGGLALAGRNLQRVGLNRDQIGTAGAMTAALFAAQMVNFPVLPWTSGHLIGGVLAARVLGPSLGALTMSIVLTIQALTLGDGGLAALGANIVNMALLPAGMVALVRERIGKLRVAGLAAASVMGAALLMLAEIALNPQAASGPDFFNFAWRMIAIHGWIAVPEALLTVGVLQLLGADSSPGQLRLDALRKAACYGSAVFFVLCLLPHTSLWPDGYESAARNSGLIGLLTEDQESLARVGRLNSAAASCQREIVTWVQTLFSTDQFLGLIAMSLAATAATAVARVFTPTSPTR